MSRVGCTLENGVPDPPDAATVGKEAGPATPDPAAPDPNEIDVLPANRPLAPVMLKLMAGRLA